MDQGVTRLSGLGWITTTYIRKTTFREDNILRERNFNKVTSQEVTSQDEAFQKAACGKIALQKASTRGKARERWSMLVARSGREPTIKDIAKAAGVSVSTVSHVLNEYGDISEDTEQKVREVMKELNYHPSALARRLVRKRSYILQLLLFSVEGLKHPFFYEVICGISTETEKAGYDLVLSIKDVRDRRWRDSLKRCYESRSEGIFVMGTLPGPEVLEEIESSQMPALFIDIPHEGPRATYVTSDNIGGAMTATKHLISLGHTRIGLINGHVTSAISKQRLLGYKQALERHGIPFDAGLVRPGGFTEEGARQVTRGLLDDYTDMTAVFAGSDLMAIGAMKAIREAGLRIPDDIAVIGFDDIESARYVRPALTTVKQEGEVMGKKAARELLKLIRYPDRKPCKQVLSTELVIRESCGGREVYHEGGGTEAALGV